MPAMTYPIVNETPTALQGVTHDTFIDDLRTRPGAPAPFAATAITPRTSSAPAPR